MPYALLRDSYRLIEEMERSEDINRDHAGARQTLERGDTGKRKDYIIKDYEGRVCSGLRILKNGVIRDEILQEKKDLTGEEQ